ncbi:MAG: hypothetical protein ABIF71_05100 [Planctomycetota bacterium]
MTEWWNGLSGWEHVYLYVALPASVVLLLQTLLTFVGLGHGDAEATAGAGHAEADGGSDAGGHVAVPFNLFTVRNFVAFFTLFGWTGLAMTKNHGPAASMLVAILIGSMAMALMAIFMRFVYGMQSSGNYRLADAVGKTGDVYLVVPAAMEGFGKVNVIIGEIKRELKARTRGERIPTGVTVTVVEISNDTLVVERNN